MIPVFELARTFFAGLSAANAAIQIWRTIRDKKAAAKEFDRVFEETQRSPQAEAAASELVAIIPPEVIEDLEARADSCWTGYRKVLGGDYLPDEVEKATVAVQACVCRELRRLKTLNGSIPPRWQPQWEKYNCENQVEQIKTPHFITSTSRSRNQPQEQNVEPVKIRT
jgi:hypothetical protein